MKPLNWLFISGIFLLVAFRSTNYHRVSGTIQGVVGNPIINAVISEKGKNSTKTVTTDHLGRYLIKLSTANATLVIGSFAYDTTEIEVKGRKTVNLILQPKQKEPHEQTPQKNYPQDSVERKR